MAEATEGVPELEDQRRIKVEEGLFEIIDSKLRTTSAQVKAMGVKGLPGF